MRYQRIPAVNIVVLGELGGLDEYSLVSPPNLCTLTAGSTAALHDIPINA